MAHQGTSAAPLPRPPDATTLSVRDLVLRTLEGAIRVPEFQRGLKWRGEDHRRLLDSIYRGYPIGSLLVWKRPVEEAVVQLGPNTIHAKARSDGWLVVDGQQRLAALSGTLANRDPEQTPTDEFSVWFDLEAEQFLPTPGRGEIPSTWIPVPELLDGSRTIKWLLRWPFLQSRPELRDRAIEAGTRIREYKVPIYVVEASAGDEGALREIFARVNTTGKRMERDEVFLALAGATGRASPSIDTLEHQLAQARMGSVRRGVLTQAIMAILGLDVTRGVHEQPRLPQDDLHNAIALAAESMPRVLAFLRDDARVPHLCLLPYPVPLVVLARFFHFFPEPRPRSRTLLRRWIWRGMLSGEHDSHELSRLRRAVRAIREDEEESVQRVIELVTATPSVWRAPRRVDARGATTRIGYLALANSLPRNVVTEEMLDVHQLLQQDELNAFRKMAGAHGEGIGARFLHPIVPGGFRRPLESRISGGLFSASDLVLTSQVVPAGFTAVDAAFIAAREALLEHRVAEISAAQAEWGYGDRPSLDSLIGREESGASDV